MKDIKKPTRVEAVQEMEQWKGKALALRDVVIQMVKYHNSRVAPVQFIQTKKFVAKCSEAGLQLDVFIGSDPILGTVSSSIIAVDSDTAQSTLDADLDEYGLLDFIKEETVQPWMTKVVDLNDLSLLEEPSPQT
jgi:hypothetical protein